MTLNERVDLAVELFMQGYNCSQSVVAAFADIYGLNRETALRISASFGAGIGRQRLTCGTACGIFLLCGLEKCALDGADQQSKSENYALVQQLARRFKEENGSITCAELLQMRKNPVDTSPVASERTAEYYRKRPCARMVHSAASIYADFLRERHPEMI